MPSSSVPRASRSATRPTATSQLGPLISEEQYKRVTGYIEEGQRGGARLALGGGRSSVPVADDGYYVEPTIFVDVTPGHAHRQGGDLRAGPVGPHVRGRGRRDPDRQRRDVRAGGDRLDDRPRARLPGRGQDRRGHHLDQLPALPAGQRAVRGPQDVRPRRGPRGRGAPDVHPPQDPLHQLQRRRRWHGPEPCDAPPTWRRSAPSSTRRPGSPTSTARRTGCRRRRPSTRWTRRPGTGRRAPATGSPTGTRRPTRRRATSPGSSAQPEDTIATIPASSVGTGLVAGMLWDR